MAKRNKTISIDEFVLNDIESNKSMTNFSQWVEAKYTEEFMTLKAKRQRFQSLSLELDKLKSSIIFEETAVTRQKEFTGFCPSCGDPMNGQFVFLKEKFPICKICLQSNPEMAVRIFNKVVQSVEQREVKN